MADLESLKKQLIEKESEFRNICDQLLTSVGDDPELNKRRESIKSELQLLKSEILELDSGEEEEDWETDAESNNMGS
jgi:hypothetical protein